MAGVWGDSQIPRTETPVQQEGANPDHVLAVKRFNSIIQPKVSVTFVLHQIWKHGSTTAQGSVAYLLEVFVEQNDKMTLMLQ
jgi:hypothetical protein